MHKFALHHAEKVRTSAGTLPCLVHEPPGFAEDRRPCLLFLHGSAERGSDLAKLTKLGIPELIERGRNVPFVAISPQCPAGRTWGDFTGALGELLDALLPELAVDMTRLYLTGVSMGGFGAWKLAAEQAARFAALVPVCGWGDPGWAPRLRHLPIWVFHGAADNIVAPQHSQEMVDALRRLGRTVRFTLYEGVGHDAWNQAYDTPELYDWMLGQRRHEEGDLLPP